MNPSPRAGRRLSELLEEQQEPFLLEAYLVEHGCSADRIITSHATPLCFPEVKSCRRLERRLSGNGGFLRGTLTKLMHGRAYRPKFLHLVTQTIDHPILSFSADCLLSEDSKHQLSPVSVLELHSDDTSPFHDHIKDERRSTSSMDSPRSDTSYITLEDVDDKSHILDEKAGEPSKGGMAELGSVEEAEDKIWSCQGLLSSGMFRGAMKELLLLWGSQGGEVTQLRPSYFSGWREDWKPYVREIELLIEADVFDALLEEVIFDMLADLH